MKRGNKNGKLEGNTCSKGKSDIEHVKLVFLKGKSSIMHAHAMHDPAVHPTPCMPTQCIPRHACPRSASHAMHAHAVHAHAMHSYAAQAHIMHAAVPPIVFRDALIFTVHTSLLK
jgi:hypothetical protein